MTGRLMNETLGKLHFWITLLAAYATFLPMHFAGLAGEPRHYSQLAGTTPALQALLPLQKHITYFALVLASAQFLFPRQSAMERLPRQSCVYQPWQATTLEWAPPLENSRKLSTSPSQPRASQSKRKVYRGPYEYGLRPDGADFIMQCHPNPKPE